MSLRRFVAEEQNAIGHYAEALGSAERCVREAERDVTSPIHQEHVAACTALVGLLRNRVAHVLVHMPSVVPAGTQVMVAGVAVEHALWDVPLTVNPGVVVTEVTAPGHAAYRSEVSIASGATVPVAVAIGPVPAAIRPAAGIGPVDTARSGSMPLVPVPK